MQEKYTLGMIGLGTMGRNLLLNMADHGFAVAGHDKNPAQLALLESEGKGKPVKGFSHLEDLIKNLTVPRVLMLLVPAGKIVDSVIGELSAVLQPGDIIIDAGNSHFRDTMLRDALCKEKGFHFFGMGISGGEEGARKGPSMMPGGDKEAYVYVKPVLNAIAARIGDEPCVAYIGPGASGHFVKMVHNGIEYALMQLIADSYELMKKGLQLDNSAINEVFSNWNNGRLQSYLLEITSDIFRYKQKTSSEFLVDAIKDEAKAKGTGKWTSQIAMELELPVPVIDSAVCMRDLSKYKSLRMKTARIYPQQQDIKLKSGAKEFLVQLEAAYFFSMSVIYAQGMHLLAKGSEANQYNLHLDEIAKIWRGGCIIRAKFLDLIYKAFQKTPLIEHLLLDESVAEMILQSNSSIRNVVSESARCGISIPAFSASLSYFDAIRSERMPSNLIQAQRDYFGAHTYELTGKEGVFHTEWNGIPS
ncbi:MAG TPA: NADP-dependent phosphogluconate dehydrogenase [Flavitalea sp.]|nr:NADP-dependent phosphogluconate dehydrogenase [Flavitalea sp.]